MCSAHGAGGLSRIAPVSTPSAERRRSARSTCHMGKVLTGTPCVHMRGKALRRTHASERSTDGSTSRANVPAV